MSKPTPPLFPDLHPNTPFQQMRPQLDAYRKQVEAFYNSLEHHVDNPLGQATAEYWSTKWSPIEMSDEELKAQLDGGTPSAAALALLRKKANL